MSPELIALLIALIQQAPAAIAAGQAMLAQIESGTAPTEAQIQALAASFATAETAAETAIGS